MIGGLYQTAPETQMAMHSMPSNHSVTDITQLIQLLISEIRVTLHSRIDLLNEKINLKNEENERLRNENNELKQLVAEQSATIEAMSNVNNQKPTPTLTTMTYANVLQNGQAQAQQPQILPQSKQRGIKAYNLIISCDNLNGKDPKTFVENILLQHFGKKPALTAVQLLPTTRRPVTPKVDARGTEPIVQSATPQEVRILTTFNSALDVRSIYMDRVRALHNTGIFISEDLYKEESYLFYLTRILKRNSIIHSTWTENGEVYIKESQASLPRIVNIKDQIFENIDKNISSDKQVTSDNQVDNSPKIPSTSHTTSTTSLPKISQSEPTIIENSAQPSEKLQEVIKTTKKRNRKKQNEEQDGSR